MALTLFSRGSHAQESFFWFPDSTDSRMDMRTKGSKPGRPLPDTGDLTRVAPGAVPWMNSGHFVPDWQDSLATNFDVELMVPPQEHPDLWVRGGLLFLENRTAGTNGAWCVLSVTSHNGVVFNANENPGTGQVHRIARSRRITLPVWLRLMRRNKTVTGYIKSSPREDWQSIGEAAAPGSASPQPAVAEMLILRQERVPPALARTRTNGMDP